MSWRDITLDDAQTCWEEMRGPMEFVIALSGSFKHSGSRDELASRFGAISQTKGRRYWSTTDNAWRILISDAYALQNANAIEPYPDFSVAEVLSGTPLYFMQDDTRSTGRNTYSMKTLTATEDRLVIITQNISEIRFAFFTLFETKALLSVYFLNRLGPTRWGYFSLTAIRKGFVDGNANSFVNRAAAFYRFLRGVAGDSEPPLAP